jgi:hypothetical protein
MDPLAIGPLMKDRRMAAAIEADAEPRRARIGAEELGAGGRAEHEGSQYQQDQTVQHPPHLLTCQIFELLDRWSIIWHQRARPTAVISLLTRSWVASMALSSAISLDIFTTSRIEFDYRVVVGNGAISVARTYYIEAALVACTLGRGVSSLAS